MERFAHHGSLLLQCIRAGVCFRVRAIKISACGYVPAGALKSAQNLYVSGVFVDLCVDFWYNMLRGNPPSRFDSQTVYGKQTVAYCPAGAER